MISDDDCADSEMVFGARRKIWSNRKAPKILLSAPIRWLGDEMERSDLVIRWTLAGLAGAILGYCVLVMVFVATAPDLRLRFMLIGPSDSGSGIVIKKTINPIVAPIRSQSRRPLQRQPAAEESQDTQDKGVRSSKNQMRTGDEPHDTQHEDSQSPLPEAKAFPLPAEGDILVELRGRPISTSLDFMREQFAIRNLEPDLRAETAGITQASNVIPIKFRRQGATELTSTELVVQSVPLHEVGLTLAWFLLELLIFSVGAVAFWNRPFDDAARLFFAMCTVTLAAFVGGFHWWTVGSSFWLNLPFATCAILLPAVILHFFLVYPRPKPLLSHWRGSVIAGVYAIPVASIVGFLIVDGFLWFLTTWTDRKANIDVKLLLLNWLRIGIYSYICVAATYFVLALGALAHSWLTTRNPVERNQVRWILRAGCVASFFIGYSLYLAFFDRDDFVLGGGRLSMFLASLVFMIAYAVGIVRYKLMLIDQIVNRGMSYYILSYGATAGVALAVASGTTTMMVRKSLALEQQPWIIAGILMVAVILLIWLRDLWQTLVDRRFFREKYRLDKTLQRMNQAVGRLADVDFLSERMLTSCRDVLQSELTALYLRDPNTTTFRLAGAEGDSAGLPMQFTANPEFCQALQVDPTLQRVTPGSRDSMTPTQSLLRQVKADLVHGLETNGEITGVVVLGSKQNGLMYSAEDLTFLTALGQVTGIALHCANVHQNLKHLNEELRSKVDQLSQQKQQIAILQAELSTNRIETHTAPSIEFRRESIIGHSPSMGQVLDMVRKVAPSDTNVLVRGESGTGKELLAAAIHENSPRRNGPLVSVHCAALSAGLLESELFGHVQGSFTGAHADKQGRFELANGGSLFLDEIGDISLETQVKLLRVLQQREFEPVGGTKTIQVDVRLIAATHQNLERLISEGKFREDLYYRLNVISIVLPPLRERSDDILDLAVFFLKAAASRSGKRIGRFGDDALNALMQYSWPGNIRELQNVIERAVVLGERDTIELSDLPFPIQSLAGSPRLVASGVGRETFDVRSQPASSWSEDDPTAERQLLLDALQQCNGNKTKAARKLGLPRSTYFSKLKKFGITDDEPPEVPRYGRLPR